MLLALTTMTIITVVKSSLALSLGLVGALSIVRFRSAIKEPEELTYLFFTIAIGLGLGANQVLVTVVAFIVIILVIWFRYFLSSEDMYSNMFLTISIEKINNENLKHITDIVTQNFKDVELKRYDETDGKVEVVLSIESNDVREIDKCKIDLQKINESVNVSFIDNRGLI